MSVVVLVRFAATKRGWRWRCELCPGFGFADDEQAATDDYERHYQVTPGHRLKEDE